MTMFCRIPELRIIMCADFSSLFYKMMRVIFWFLFLALTFLTKIRHCFSYAKVCSIQYNKIQRLDKCKTKVDGCSRTTEYFTVHRKVQLWLLTHSMCLHIWTHSASYQWMQINLECLTSFELVA